MKEDQKKQLGRPVELKKQELSKLKSIGHALVKGGVKGFFDIGQLGQPVLLEDEPFEERQKILSEAEKYRGHLEESLEEKMPSYPEFTEKALERGSRLAVSGGGLKGFVAGAAGQLAEQLGAPEWGQTLAEISGFSMPALGRKIIPTKSQEKLVELARRSGMTEEQIAPLIPSKEKRGFFKKIASKGTKTQEALGRTKKGIDEAYQFVEHGPLGQTVVNPANANKFVSDIHKVAMSLPDEIRGKVLADYKDLLKSKGTLQDFANFYHDISSQYKINRGHLERFKKPVLEAMESTSPEFAQDFKLVNELYKRRIAASKALKAGEYEGLIELGDVGNLIKTIVSPTMKTLAFALGVTGARRFAREMLINPRLQNIHMQMIKAINNKQLGIAADLAKYIQERYKDDTNPTET